LSRNMLPYTQLTSQQVCAIVYSCFFFQAEDGIRDRNVTGVQTCALPILFTIGIINIITNKLYIFHWVICGEMLSLLEKLFLLLRSEERRVGKECRSMGSLEPSR